MSEIIYNKLIRDKIPEIIENTGKSFKTRMLNDEEYVKELYKKLNEEVAEFNEDNEIKELCDIVEVIHAILKARGVTESDFENQRLEKLKARGGFDKKIFLESVEK